MLFCQLSTNNNKLILLPGWRRKGGCCLKGLSRKKGRKIRDNISRKKDGRRTTGFMLRARLEKFMPGLLQAQSYDVWDKAGERAECLRR